MDGDSIANGANDNASGTTALIELARFFARMGVPERTLLFAAFTAEEAGGFGSRHFSNQLDPDRIVAMFNIEMIGKPAVSGPNTAWVTGFERSDLGAILQRSVEGTEYSFYADPYPEQDLFYRSDNATLARLGVPAHSISTTPIDVDTDYHGDRRGGRLRRIGRGPGLIRQQWHGGAPPDLGPQGVSSAFDARAQTRAVSSGTSRWLR